LLKKIGYGSENKKGRFNMKILVGFDGTNAAKEAIALAEKHSQAFKATIVLAYSMVGGPEVPRRDFEIAENTLEHEKNDLLDKGLPCETIMSVRGLEAGEDLVQIAGEYQVDEVIIGVRRRSKVGKIIFGSTAQLVVLNAPCPVVTVK
jgi:nucleotide-binding universal stress UspA family protein